MTSAAPLSIPALPSLSLTEDERRTWNALRRKLAQDTPHLETANRYYEAQQGMTTLGISMPPELEGLRTVLGWPRLAVDAPHERLGVVGFRYPDALDADSDMQEIWQRSNLDADAPLAHLDALIFRRGFVVAGMGEDGFPLITVESPLHMTAMWDARRRHTGPALQFYRDEADDQFAALYLPDQTITLAHTSGRGWTIEGRDQHNQGWVPVMVMANRARTHDRAGTSEITPEVRSITDAACRTLLDLEISREFYAAPQRYILGATEEAFQDSQGNPKSAWETYRGRVLALERDEEGNVPQVGSFAAYDPGVYSRVIDTYAEIMASITGLPAAYLGKTTDQPASADAIRMSTDRLVQKVRLKQNAFEHAWEGAMRMAMAFRDGTIPDAAMRIETIWRNPEVPTPAATTDAIQKQIASGYMPPRSDVAGEVLGYTPNQRARIAAEWARQDGEGALRSVLDRVRTADRPADADPFDPTGQSTGQPPGDTGPAAPGPDGPADGPDAA